MKNRLSIYALTSVFILGVYAFGIFDANLRRSNTFAKVNRSIIEGIISDQGHFIGFFGQCPYKKNSKFYVPCRTLLTPQQIADFESGSK